MMRLPGKECAIVLIDGEHHPAAVGDALAELRERVEVAAVVFCGGSEKVGPAALAAPEEAYGFGLTFGDDPADALSRALSAVDATVVIDLADEPVVKLDEKLRLASLALAHGVSYEAPGMFLDPPQLIDIEFDGPKLAVIGTGKRTGKTAVSGHLAGLISGASGSPAIVSMGRGGPVEPQIAHPGTGLEELLALARGGVHAASDYLEDAVLAGVPAVGCRRVGGGPGGQSGFTNFETGARMAAELDGVDCLLFEGSGAAVPPVRADRTICVVGSAEQATTLAGPLRLLQSDLVLVPEQDPTAAGAVARWTSGEVVRFSLRPTPASPLPPDAVTAFFTTGSGELEGAEPVFTSQNLARRDLLEEDLRDAAALGCTHYLTELKAAAIDTVAMRAEAAGADVVFVRNRPVGEAGVDLDVILLDLYDRAAMHSAAVGAQASDGP